MSSSDSLRDTIIPKSDQLNADDLITGPITVRVEDVRRSNSNDQPVAVLISGHRPFMPCKSMRRVLIAAWGERGKDWIGKSMTLYCDPAVKYGGVAVGGVRISHLSDIDNAMSIMLTTAKSKRAPYVVEPLPSADYPAADFDKNAPAWRDAIESGRATVDDIQARVATKGMRLSAEQIASLEAPQ